MEADKEVAKFFTMHGYLSEMLALHSVLLYKWEEKRKYDLPDHVAEAKVLQEKINWIQTKIDKAIADTPRLKIEENGNQNTT